MLEKVYLETSIISYLTARPSKDIIILGHQILTKDWWEKSKNDYELFISEPTIDEISLGDPDRVKDRTEIIKGINALSSNKEIQNLVKLYMNHFKFSKKLELDITHIAYSIYYEMDYLLTWNCKHIANAHFKVQLSNFNKKKNILMPEICTPEELTK